MNFVNSYLKEYQKEFYFIVMFWKVFKISYKKKCNKKWRSIKKKYWYNFDLTLAILPKVKLIRWVNLIRSF